MANSRAMWSSDCDGTELGLSRFLSSSSCIGLEHSMKSDVHDQRKQLQCTPGVIVTAAAVLAVLAMAFCINNVATHQYSLLS